MHRKKKKSSVRILKAAEAGSRRVGDSEWSWKAEE